MTEKEIVQALRYCSNKDCIDCAACKYFGYGDCLERLVAAAADLIERLTAENADLRKELERKDMVIALAQKKQAEAEAERDVLWGELAEADE